MENKKIDGFYKTPYSIAYNQALTNIETFKTGKEFDKYKVKNNLDELRKKFKFTNCFKFINDDNLADKIIDLMEILNNFRNFFSHNHHDDIKLSGEQKDSLKELFANAVLNVTNISNSEIKETELFDKKNGTMLSKTGEIFLVSLFANKQTIKSLLSEVLKLPNKAEKPDIYTKVQTKHDILSYYSRKTKFSLLGKDTQYEQALDIASYITKLPEYFDKDTVDKIPSKYKKDFVINIKKYGEENKLSSPDSKTDYQRSVIRQSNKFMEYALRYIESKNLFDCIVFDAFDPDDDISNRRYRIKNNSIKFSLENKKYSIDKRELYQLLYIILTKCSNGKNIITKIKALQYKYVFNDLYELFEGGIIHADFDIKKEQDSISDYYDTRRNNTTIYRVRNNKEEKTFIKGHLPKNWVEFFEANSNKDYSDEIKEKIRKHISSLKKDKCEKTRTRVFDKVQNVLDLWIFIERYYHPYKNDNTKRLTSGEYKLLTEYMRYPIQNEKNLKNKYKELFTDMNMSKYWTFPVFEQNVDMIEVLNKQAIKGWNSILDDLLKELQNSEIDYEKFKQLLKIRNFRLNKNCPQIIKPDDVNTINTTAEPPKLAKDGKVIFVIGIAQEIWKDKNIRISKAILNDTSVQVFENNYPLLFKDTFPTLEENEKWLKRLNKKIYDTKVEDKLLAMILKENINIKNPTDWFNCQSIKIEGISLTYSDYKRIEGRISGDNFKHIINNCFKNKSNITYEDFSDKLKKLKEGQKSVINQILAEEERLNYKESGKNYTDFKTILEHTDLSKDLQIKIKDMRNAILHTNYDKKIFYEIKTQTALLNELNKCKLVKE